MTIRLIASDLDGTLFGADSLPEPRTVAAVNAAIDAGYLFVAVTGRSHFGGAERLTRTGVGAHWFIGSNGGHRLNLRTSVLEERLRFTPDDVERITRLDRLVDGLGFGLEHEAGFTYDDRFRAVFPSSFDGGPRRNTTTWSADDVGKIFATHPEMTVDELIGVVVDLVPPGTHVSTSGTSFVEFTPAGADKALGLERLCGLLDIAARDVIAFGDNNNDLSMLAWAGRGVAVANATEAARAAADEVTSSNLDFGVAEVIESLIADR